MQLYVEVETSLVVDEEVPLVQTPKRYSGYTSDNLQHGKSTLSYKKKTE